MPAPIRRYCTCEGSTRGASVVVVGGPDWDASDSASCSGWTVRDSLYPSFFSECSVGGGCRNWRYTWGGGGGQLEKGVGERVSVLRTT